MTLRFGIVGRGYMGAIREAAIAAREDCEVARVVDGEGGSWRPVVEDPSLDAVVVCLPNHLTRDAVCAALAAGKHVLAEKPPGRTVAELEAMIDAAEASGRTLKFGFNHRLHPAVRAAERLLSGGTLGAVRWLRGRYGKGIEPGFHAGWRARRALAGGGILLDQGIHMLDLLRALAPGAFTDVHAFASRTESEEVEDDVVAILRTDDGVLATLASSHTQWAPRFELEIGLSAGAITVRGLLSKSGRYGPERLLWRTRDDPTEHVESFPVDDSWALEIDELVECARAGAPVRVGSTAEALQLMILVERIYASAGRPP